MNKRDLVSIRPITFHIYSFFGHSTLVMCCRPACVPTVDRCRHLSEQRVRTSQCLNREPFVFTVPSTGC